MIAFWLFIIVGLISGIYHGFYNNQIYHNSNPNKNIHEKIHTIWIHIVSGIVGSFSLYILFTKFYINSHKSTIGIGEVGALLFGILGIVGLLPMALWFTVLSINKLQDAFFNLFKK